MATQPFTPVDGRFRVLSHVVAGEQYDVGFKPPHVASGVHIT